ncbi:hypothetical protein GPJ56_002196 [Histomonas meleagridis]|uniref:uncharacterized protein n=1 Tax=Histomonas meleagridis TaxID=135588 RepID=UPI00355A8DB7|nr:hypothetical protein GPJ56_002196 [Histomonas meleagridis]KAH0806625.1 hypothetical protein GO595_000476 [Histomonas meleagridis]
MSFATSNHPQTNQLMSDVTNFKKLWETKVKKNIENLKKHDLEENTIKAIKNTMNQLEKLSNQIKGKIGNNQEAKAIFDPVFNEFSQQKPNILQLIQKFEDKKRAQDAAEDAKALQATEGNVDQLQVQHDAEDLQFIHEQTQDIVEDMKALKEITEQVNNKVQADHEVVVRIDNKIEEAKTDMVEGNKDLEKAQEDQKKTCHIC